MSKLKNLEIVVMKVLEEETETRKNDFILYAGVLRKLGIGNETNLFKFLENARKQNIPPFESVTRCRRHIQSIREDLKHSKTAIAREDKIEEYKAYNISWLGE